ncbi:hypothetical protein EVAR_44884_1 [Eumeta japonica]|uniref:Uncharacterized protein n=1 Tax=Eumeta variegata TaxID=151549 RepID=A0A4C1Y9V4_EUMVA|nr:hypothetical protein EVAR_44884_1 [Eumeta japonica]
MKEGSGMRIASFAVNSERQRFVRCTAKNYNCCSDLPNILSKLSTQIVEEKTHVATKTRSKQAQGVSTSTDWAHAVSVSSFYERRDELFLYPIINHKLEVIVFPTSILVDDVRHFFTRLIRSDLTVRFEATKDRCRCITASLHCRQTARLVPGRTLIEMVKRYSSTSASGNDGRGPTAVRRITPEPPRVNLLSKINKLGETS